jgi:hypothetical protein
MISPEEYRNGTETVVESAAGKLELRLLPFALARIDWL